MQTTEHKPDLHYIKPSIIFRHNGVYYMERHGPLTELVKHFNVFYYAILTEVDTLDQQRYNRLPEEITFIHFFDSRSAKEFIFNWFRYKKKVTELPRDGLYLINYPQHIVSVFIGWMIRKRKLTIWINSDPSITYNTRAVMFEKGFLIGTLKYLFSPLRSFLYKILTYAIIKDNLVFYTANTLFQKDNHRNQHEVISVPILNRDQSLVKANFTKSICFISNETAYKGVTVLLKALHEIPQASRPRLDIIGFDSFTKKKNQELAQELEVRFHGRVYNRQALFRILAQNDILVMPSNGEKQGMVQLEAMSVGVVPICSDSGGTYMTVSNYFNGLLFKTGDHDMLAEKIQLLYKNPDLYKNLQKNGLQWVQTLSIEKMFEIKATIIKNHFKYHTDF